MIQCFADHPGQPLEAPKDAPDRKKKGGGKTVSSYFKGQLDDLMTTLYKTEPHFIRCVVPNTHKQPGGSISTAICVWAFLRPEHQYFHLNQVLNLALSCTSTSATVSLLESQSVALDCESILFSLVIKFLIF